jgi:predicted DNA binding CopG/RHH family protein
MKHKADEDAILEAYEGGTLKSVSPSKREIKQFRDAARATFVPDRHVDIRLSSPDLMDIQARAAEEGVPCQTLIASVLHKFVAGRLLEKPSRLATRSGDRAKKRRAVGG